MRKPAYRLLSDLLVLIHSTLAFFYFYFLASFYDDQILSISSTSVDREGAGGRKEALALGLGSIDASLI